jgi:hypothetical protein
MEYIFKLIQNFSDSININININNNSEFKKPDAYKNINSMTFVSKKM